MIRMDTKEIYKKTIEKWGKTAQVLMAIEEMSELTKELLKDLRGKSCSIQEEIVDVEIMLEQLKEIFGTEYIDIFRKSKLQRLEAMLDG